MPGSISLKAFRTLLAIGVVSGLVRYANAETMVEYSAEEGTWH